MTSLPDDNPKTAHGAQKAPMHLIPPPALLELAWAMGEGAKKYGPYNWREKHISASVYQAAALRHLMAWWQGQDTDPSSGAHHLAHAMACCAIALDSIHHGMMNDDRPVVRK
jgi:hypothetical protein